MLRGAVHARAASLTNDEPLANDAPSLADEPPPAEAPPLFISDHFGLLVDAELTLPRASQHHRMRGLLRLRRPTVESIVTRHPA